MPVQPFMPYPAALPQQPFYTQPYIQGPNGVIYVPQSPNRPKKRTTRRHRHHSSRRRTRESDSAPPSRPSTGMGHVVVPESEDEEDDTGVPVIPDMTDRSFSMGGHSRNQSRNGHSRSISHAGMSVPTAPTMIGPIHPALPMSNNTLPSPPHDVYDMTPHRQVLNLGETAGLLTEMMSEKLTKDAKNKGLRRIFGRHKSKKDKTRFVPVPFDATTGTAATGVLPTGISGYDQLMQAATSSHGHGMGEAGPSGHQHSMRSHHTAMPEPEVMPVPTMAPPGIVNSVPPIPDFSEPIMISANSPFLLQSEHQVPWQDATTIFPTAFHLFEALKFYPHAMDIFEQIRHIMRTEDVTAFAARNANRMSPDWNTTFAEHLKATFLAKFRFHPDLRQQLMETGARELILDSSEGFWGVDSEGEGMNYMGKALMQVRDVLRAEAQGMMSP
ncbi:hypothetical protein CYLTODRAFT_406837 [Cylindrobasidium torrendii FP15055 ss-10]|uniref:NADAR domain-containing protein n=1 Tax=Cylindrobasidium torrendii FP15055 ss-10 TaxID=1314674 RepID=A0A0D7BRV2_9AGAR|nr:hypothetical protein CYLTODRAFT_406837 [Cylindrobasidium torrendii FP15055 ss-10]